MSLLEASELVKDIEETFGVSRIAVKAVEVFAKANLLQGHSGAGLFQLALDLLGLVLGNALSHRLRSALDDLLGTWENVDVECEITLSDYENRDFLLHLGVGEAAREAVREK